MPDRYADLNDDAIATVDKVMLQFADMFDNDEFGPFIKEFTNFGRDRYVQLLDLAIGDVELVCGLTGLNWNADTYPYRIGVANRAITIALTIEVIRHFLRSYVEIPDTGRVGAPDVVRRDYLSRWQGLLNDYQNQLKDAGKRLTAELYSENVRRYQKVLVDLGSMKGIVNIDQPAERPQLGWWW